MVAAAPPASSKIDASILAANYLSMFDIDIVASKPVLINTTGFKKLNLNKNVFTN
jgi:hypothetical protein